jgi:hypothetical protein
MSRPSEETLYADVESQAIAGDNNQSHYANGKDKPQKLQKSQRPQLTQAAPGPMKEWVRGDPGKACLHAFKSDKELAVMYWPWFAQVLMGSYVSA